MGSPDRERDAWRTGFVAGLASLLSMAGLMAWTLQSYFGVDVAASLSFHGADGWCDPAVSGLGVHCWGDWAAIRFHALGDAAGTAEAVYPLSSRLFRLPFEAVSAMLSPFVGLFCFITACATALIAPWVRATRDLSLNHRVVVISLAGVLTAPVAITLDRGNVIAFVVPALYLWLIGIRDRRPAWILLGVVLAAAIKPQLALLAIVFLSLGQAIWFLRAVIAVLLVWLLPLGIGGDLQGALNRWQAGIRTFAAAQPLGADYPVNVSIPHLLMRLFTSVGVPAQPGVVVALWMLCCAGMLVTLIWRGDRIPAAELASTLLALAALSAPTTYAYYYVFAIPVGALAFRWGGLDPMATDRRRDRLFAVAVVCSLTPLLLPIAQLDARPGTSVVVSATPLVATLLWLTFVAHSTLRCLHSPLGGRSA